MNRLLTLAIFAACALGVSAAEPADSIVPTIADHLTSTGKATVKQPAKLNERLRPAARTAEPAPTEAARPGAATEAARTAGGYRILVFSGNNPRSARAEAHGRAAAIGAEFPEWATYVTFDSPYWRLKVGDFRSYEDGRAALSLLKKHFPAYAKEMRLVRDRIKN